MTNKKITEYDETKRMLNTLRRLNESVATSHRLLREDDSSDVQDDLAVINGVDTKILSSDEQDMKFTDEEKTSLSSMIDNFKQQVSNLVDFEPGFTISSDQIRLDGMLTDYDIDFVLIAGEEHGLYINADMLKVEKEVVDLITKLQKYYETFVNPMNELITKRKTN